MLKMTTARVTVQFQSVTEKLTPHDTVFTFATPSDLRDSTLSSACSLHTASTSVKSSDECLPQRGLAEITEDLSESPIDKKAAGGELEEVKAGEVHRPSSGNSQTGKANGSASSSHHHGTSPPSMTTQSPHRPRTSSNIDKNLPPTPGEHIQAGTGPEIILDYGGFASRPSIDGRFSSQSARPITRDLDNAYQYKPKVKLGPRPSMDSSVARLDKSDGGSFRPVSTLPAGLRMPPRKVVSGRPKSSQAQNSFSDKLSSRQPPPPAPVTPIQIPDRKTQLPSNGLPTPAKTPEPKSPKMTPEKRKLMKALQIRQRQLAAQKPVTRLGIDTLPADEENTEAAPDESTTSAICDEITPPAESDLAHNSIRDIGREEHRNLEASPISRPETCEGLSTQASSIAEEEVAGQKPLGPAANPDVGCAIAENIEPPPVNDNEDRLGHSIPQAIIGSERESHEVDLTREMIPMDSHRDSKQPALPAEQPLPFTDTHSARDPNIEREPQVSSASDPPAPPLHIYLVNEKVSIEDKNEEEASSQTTPPEDVGKISEQSISYHNTSTSQDLHAGLRASEAHVSSSAGASAVPMEDVDAYEVPLPPIDEDEEIFL